MTQNEEKMTIKSTSSSNDSHYNGAGRETSQRSRRGKYWNYVPLPSTTSRKRGRFWNVPDPMLTPSSPSDLKSIGLFREHLEHFVLCLRDAYGFRDPLEVVEPISRRLFELLPGVSPEKFFKWFYGNSLGWATNILTDVLPFPGIDKLGLDSTSYKSACKIFGGRLMKFLQRLFRRLNLVKPGSVWRKRKAALSDAQTFLMFKKGSPLVSEDLVSEADQKHKAAMSNTLGGIHPKKLAKAILPYNPKEDNMFDFPVILQDPLEIHSAKTLSWGEVEEAEDRSRLAKNILRQVDRLIRDVFRPQSFLPILGKGKDFFPSTRAHHGSSRSKGGASGKVKDFLYPFDEGELDRMTYHPRVGVRSHYFIDYPHLAGDVAAELSNYLNVPFEAEPVYLREPLKIRTITKGPSVPYWAFRPIQKFLWSGLAKHPLFELIGKPISSEVLNKMLPWKTKDSFWLSGDYSAATDNLGKWLSNGIWDRICDFTGIPDVLRKLGKKGLTGHKIIYPDGTEIIQQNGQLMGSPLSFPILCIANAAICTLSFSGVRRQRLFRRMALRVNGDDCVMAFSEEERKKWRELADFIGMKPSPGKCYFAKDWLQMNSELFVERNGTFRHIPFINFGLASPILTKGGTLRPIESLTDSQFAFGTSPKRIDIWLRRMGPYLKKKVPGLVSWFMPKSLGGLGLYSSRDDGSIFTNNQLQVATQFFKDGVKGVVPFTITSGSGGELNFSRTDVPSTLRLPVYGEKTNLKSYWADRFIREEKELALITPLLWENLATGSEVRLSTSREYPDILTGKIRNVFRKAKNVDPLPLGELLTFRGFDTLTPRESLESNFAPSYTLLRTLAILGTDMKSLISMIQVCKRPTYGPLAPSLY